MSNWPLVQYSAGVAVGMTGTYGTSITADNTGTKSAWTEITSSTPCAADGIVLSVGRDFATNFAVMACDLAIGASGNEIVICPNIVFSGARSDMSSTMIPLPVSIPAGVRLSMRTASANSSGSNTLDYSVLLIPQTALTPVYGGNLVAVNVDDDTLGKSYRAVTTISGNATPNANGAWTTICTSCPRDASVVLCTLVAGYGQSTGASFALDLGIDVSGTVTTLVADVCFRHGVSSRSAVQPFGLPIQFRAGDKIAARVRSSTSSGSGRELSILLYLG